MVDKLVYCPHPHCTAKNPSNLVSDIASCFIRHTHPNFFLCMKCQKVCSAYIKLREHYTSCKRISISKDLVKNFIVQEKYQAAFKSILHLRAHKKLTKKHASSFASEEKVIHKLVMSIVNENIKKQVTCCQLSFISWKKALDHIQSHHAVDNKKEYRCPDCSMQSTKCSKVLQCYILSKYTNFFECFLCGTTLKSLARLEKHILINCEKITQYQKKDSHEKNAEEVKSQNTAKPIRIRLKINTPNTNHSAYNPNMAITVSNPIMSLQHYNDYFVPNSQYENNNVHPPYLVNDYQQIASEQTNIIPQQEVYAPNPAYYYSYSMGYYQTPNPYLPYVPIQNWHTPNEDKQIENEYGINYATLDSNFYENKNHNDNLTYQETPFSFHSNEPK